MEDIPRVSIIITHWAMNAERSETMRLSLTSLFRTASETEIIVVDNGGSMSDSMWLADMCDRGHIACYVRNRKNMHFWFARNQGLKMATGDYIVIADNDILYDEGWWQGCVAFLDAHPGKYLATPIAADPMSSIRKIRWQGELDGWRLNTRAGSNVFMMRKKDQEAIGEFDQSTIAGSKYVDHYNRMGYVMALMPQPKATDLGLRRGYNFNIPITDTKL